MRFSCASLAFSLGMLAMCVVVFFNVHHGGMMYGCISSMFSAMYSGYCLTRCSRLDEKVLLFVVRQCFIASLRQIFTGCFAGSVWIRVRYLMICLRSSSSIGNSSVSYCRATVEVVLKHPVIVFIAIRCTVMRLLICEVIASRKMHRVWPPSGRPGRVRQAHQMSRQPPNSQTCTSSSRPDLERYQSFFRPRRLTQLWVRNTA